MSIDSSSYEDKNTEEIQQQMSLSDLLELETDNTHINLSGDDGESLIEIPIEEVDQNLLRFIPSGSTILNSATVSFLTLAGAYMIGSLASPEHYLEYRMASVVLASVGLSLAIIAVVNMTRQSNEAAQNYEEHFEDDEMAELDINTQGIARLRIQNEPQMLADSEIMGESEFLYSYGIDIHTVRSLREEQ